MLVMPPSLEMQTSKAGERLPCDAAETFNGRAPGVGWCRRAHLVISTPGPEHPSKTSCEGIRGLRASSNTNPQPGRKWRYGENGRSRERKSNSRRLFIIALFLMAPKLEITQMPVNGRMDKQIIACSCNGLKWK